MNYYLGVDVGTSSVKSLLMDSGGKTVGTSQIGYDIIKEKLQYAEQDMEKLWEATKETITDLVKRYPEESAKIHGISYSGQMHGLVMIGADGKLIRNAIIWADQRSEKEIQKIYDITGKDTYRGTVLNSLSTGFLISSLMWVKEHEPDNFEKIRYVVFPKDYIRYKKASGSREVQKYFDELISKGAKLTEPDVWKLYCKCIIGYQNPYVKEVSDNYSQFTELFGKKEVDTKLMEATSYAPVQFIKELCDFEGKDFNIKMRVMTDLFNQKKYDEAFAEIERLKADPSIDQHKFVKLLAFYVRVSPEYTDKELPYETLANKVRGLRYVAYNMYDRDDAMPHFYYVQGLEYLLKRALEEGKQIPADLVATPVYGKKVYDMRHPDLKVKPKRR